MTAQWDTSRYVSIFAAEAQKHLDALRLELGALEGNVTATAIDSLFRHAHSVKGMGGSMGYETITAVGFRLEELLDRVRQSPHRFDRTTAELVTRAIDALSTQVKAAINAQPFPDTAELIAQLESVTQALPLNRNPEPLEAPLVEVKAPVATAVSHVPCWSIALRVNTTIRPGVRAFLAYKRLSTLGHPVRTTPPIEDVKGGKFSAGGFLVELQTNEDEASIRRVVSQVADIELDSLSQVSRHAPEHPGPVPREATDRTVRVRTQLLDEFFDVAGELLLTANGVREVARGLDNDARAQLNESVHRLHALVRGLHTKVVSAQLSPASGMADQLPALARSLAKDFGRKIELVVLGTEVEFDRAIFEELQEAVVLVLRHAIEHSIEAPDDRRACHKAPRGTLRVSFQVAANRLTVEIEDDGRGLSASGDALLAEAHRLLSPLHGRVEVVSRSTVGTTVRLVLPVTSDKVQLLLVGVGDDVYGLPIVKVSGIVEASRASLKRDSLIQFGSGQVPIRDLATVVGVIGRPPESGHSPFVVIETSTGRVALSVDIVFGQEEVVLNEFTRPLGQMRGLTGVTVLSDGRPVFIVDVNQ